jgi:hypothetical protein
MDARTVLCKLVSRFDACVLLDADRFCSVGVLANRQIEGLADFKAKHGHLVVVLRSRRACGCKEDETRQ